MSPSPWTPERVCILRAMWEQGASASEIAKRINREARQLLVTRNAVIGKAHREELPEHPNASDAVWRKGQRCGAALRLLTPQDAA